MARLAAPAGGAKLELRAKNFSDLDLHGVDFKGADLTGANLRGAKGRDTAIRTGVRGWPGGG